MKQLPLRLTHIYGLRGLAILIVFMHHFALGFLPGAVMGAPALFHFPWEGFLYRTPANLLLNGNFAVHVFIVLSSLIVTYKLGTSRRMSWWRYVLRRYLTLTAPLIVISCLTYLLLHNGSLWSRSAAALSGSPWLGLGWPNELTFFGTVVHGSLSVLWSTGDSVFGVFWMIRYIWFAAIIGGTLWSLGLSKHLRTGLIVVGLIFSFGSLWFDVWGGLLLGEIILTQKTPFQTRWTVGWFGMLMIGLIFGSFPLFSSSNIGLYRLLVFPQFDWGSTVDFYHALGALCIVFAIFRCGVSSKLLQSRWLAWCGEQSFSIYVVHSLIIGTISSIFFVHAIRVLGYGGAVLFSFVISTAAVLMAAYVFHRYIQRPINKFLRHYLAS